jgi:hypothetical protein
MLHGKGLWGLIVVYETDVEMNIDKFYIKQKAMETTIASSLYMSLPG